jgi:hypothetical protein
MLRVLWLALIGLLLCGCQEGYQAVGRGYGDHETAVVALGVQNERGGEIGGLLRWQAPAGTPDEDEAVSVGAYGGVPIDPNTLGMIGLGGDWNLPLGAQAVLGGFFEWDVDESNPILGPQVIVDMLPNAEISPSILYQYVTYGQDLQDEGYQPEHRVYVGAKHPF